MSSMKAAPAKKPVTAKTARFFFYDIESLNNAFTLCVYDERANGVAVFYLVDEDSPADMAAFDETIARDMIVRENPALLERHDAVDVHFFDLATWEGNLALVKTFGLSDADSVNDPEQESSYGNEFRPVCDTDPGYDPLGVHGYFAGYNSFNYDTVILAAYFMEAFSHVPLAREQGKPLGTGFRPVVAKIIRGYNDELFTPQFRDYMPKYLTDGRIAGGKGWKSVPQRIRQSMMNSGRHLDVARLNEVQQKVALKRLLGGLGRQILESEKLGSHNASITSLQELYELLAYNVSDVVGLARLFEHPVYSSGFDLKKGLLDEYPETIYEKSKHGYAPNVHPKSVRRGRLGPDSTSAKFVGLILSPYGNLTDLETVSYLYPSEKVAAELGIPRVNVLDECRKFFHENIQDEAARAEFQLIFDYYRSIEGQNFNSSDEYRSAWPQQAQQPVRSLSPKGENPIPKSANNLPYFDADGRPTTCFATFSTGGIHGAEANHDLFEAELSEWEAQAALMKEVRELYPDPLVIRTSKTGVPISGGRTVKWNEVLSSKTRLIDCKEISQELEEAFASLPMAAGPEQIAAAAQEVYDRRPSIGYKPSKPRPVLFEKSGDGSTKLKKKYTYTSMDLAIHEDFTSYYPNMLRNMGAFFNKELGEDRYAKILADKDRYGRMMKDPSLSADEKERLKVLRNGTKLILNSASGAGDTQHKTPIRVNNAIISMRIMGQLFSWRIGQAQTLAGARIISTNTDGLYSVLDEETNNRVLAEQQAMIHVEIEPEPLVIVSKDSNNRLELEAPDESGAHQPWEADFVSASGGTLACFEEPRPDKSLAHPAVLDWALARYLRYAAGGYVPEWATEPISIDAPMDRRLGKRILLEAARLDDAVLAARLFQNVIAASSGMITFPFAADPVDPIDPDPEKIMNPRALQHYNRVFFVHPGKPGSVSLRAAGTWVVNPASKLKRQKDGVGVEHNPIALQICQANGFERDRMSAAANNKTLLPVDQDLTIRKIPRIEPTWSAFIENGDLKCKPESEIRDLLGCLDLDVYLSMLVSTFEANWMNSASRADSDEDEDQG